MAAGITDKFTEATNGTRPSPTTLTAQKAISASSISCGSLNGWPTATAVHFILYTITTAGAKVAGSQTDWKGIVSGTSITNLTLKAGTDAIYPVGAVVECAPTAAWADDMADGILVQHNQDGTHNTAAATTIAAALPNNSISGAALSTSAITLGYAQIVANASNSAVTATQVAGLTTTVTVPAGGRRVKITAFCRDAFTSSATIRANITIWDGVVGSGTQLSQGAGAGTGGSSVNSVVAIAVVTPAAGSKTYNIGLHAETAATATLEAGATYPAFILVELI